MKCCENNIQEMEKAHKLEIQKLEKSRQQMINTIYEMQGDIDNLQDELNDLEDQSVSY